MIATELNSRLPSHPQTWRLECLPPVTQPICPVYDLFPVKPGCVNGAGTMVPVIRPVILNANVCQSQQGSGNLGSLAKNIAIRAYGETNRFHIYEIHKKNRCLHLMAYHIPLEYRFSGIFENLNDHGLAFIR